MAMVPLMHGDSVGMAEAIVDVGNFANRLVRPFNGEKIQHGGCNKYRTRIHHQEKTRMVDTLRDHAVQVLLRIAVRILKNPVEHAHGQSGDVTRDGRDFDSGVECGNVGSLEAAAAGASDTDAFGIHIRPSQQVIERPDSVPDLPAG